MNSVEYWSHLSKTGEKNVEKRFSNTIFLKRVLMAVRLLGAGNSMGGRMLIVGPKLNFGPNLVLGRQCWSRFPGPTARSHAQDGHSTCHPDWARHFCQPLPSNHVIVHSAILRGFLRSGLPKVAWEIRLRGALRPWELAV